MEIIKNLDSNGVSAIIYANPGLGKTTALSMLPGKTLIIDVDRGTSVLKGKENIDVVRLNPNLSNLKSIIEELVNYCKYDNVCLDTVSELETAMLTNYGAEGKNDGAPEIGHYNKSKFKMSDYLRQIRNLTDKGVNVVFTAWEQNKEITKATGEKYSQLMPMIRAASETCGMVDIVAHLIISEKDGERYFALEGNGTSYAKDRLNGRKYCKVNELIMKDDNNES